MNNKSFDSFTEYDNITFMYDESYWEILRKKPEYQRKKEADRISYIWDNMIDNIHTSEDDSYEEVAREMSRLNRFERRTISKMFYEAHCNADRDDKNNITKRLVHFSDKLIFCFLFTADSVPRKNRKAELIKYCYIARGLYGSKRIIGIATEMKFKKITSFDFCLLDMPEWTQENQIEMEKFQKETGTLIDFKLSPFSESEYPE